VYLKMDSLNPSSESFLHSIAKLQTELLSGGILFLYIEGRKIKWKVASPKFDLEIFSEGSEISERSFAVRAMAEKRILKSFVPRTMYGIRLEIIVIPVVDDSGKAIGAFSMLVPREHPIAKSFRDFAPIIVELFPEGAFLYVSDLTKIAYIQGSEKFTLKSMEVGYTLKDTDIAYQTVQKQQPSVMELDASRYGVPVYIANYPLFEEIDGKRTIVATMGVVVPKGAAEKLRNMSSSLSNNLGEIAKTIEELAKSAESINSNEKKLFSQIEAITEKTEKINSISEFISSVASQTNMLGLNAAIEAARAGETGRGFSVVADEIRKLAGQSGDTVHEIQALVRNIKDSVTLAHERSAASLQENEQQAAATQQMSASIEEINALTEELSHLAKDL